MRPGPPMRGAAEVLDRAGKDVARAVLGETCETPGIRSVAAAGVLVLASAFLAGCAALGEEPSPLTSATSPSGEVVTTDWSDFPAHAGVDGEPLLEYPGQSDLPDRAREVLAGISRAIESEPGLTLMPLEPEAEWFADTNWHAQEGNGYGGQSMLTTVNCCELQSASAPDPHEGRAVLHAASDAAIAVGLDGFVLDEHTSDCNGDDDCWLWSATATDGVQWVYLTVEDGSRDASGEATRDAKEFGWPLASIAIGYGATVVESGRRDEYVDAMQSFVGQNRPPATTSDLLFRQRSFARSPVLVRAAGTRPGTIFSLGGSPFAIATRGEGVVESARHPNRELRRQPPAFPRDAVISTPPVH